MTYLYRYDGGAYEGSFEPRAALYLDTFPVTKRTAKGCWIDVYGEGKFVLDGDGKRYAYATKELALASLIARKRRQCAILRHQLKEAEALYEYATSLKGVPPP